MTHTQNQAAASSKRRVKSFVICDSPSHQGQSDVWLTPKWLLTALGKFDLDPCGQRGWVTAGKHLFERGLETKWSGRVWLNPPYGKETGAWLKKLERHGNGIALVFARTDTNWFHEINPDAVNFLKGRLKFHRADGSISTNAGTPSCLLAWGSENVDAIKVVKGCLMSRASQNRRDLLCRLFSLF